MNASLSAIAYEMTAISDGRAINVACPRSSLWRIRWCPAAAGGRRARSPACGAPHRSRSGRQPAALGGAESARSLRRGSRQQRASNCFQRLSRETRTASPCHRIRWAIRRCSRRQQNLGTTGDVFEFACLRVRTRCALSSADRRGVSPGLPRGHFEPLAAPTSLVRPSHR